ncbi:MAG: phage portal protein [Ferruginibacter sp.]|nr:phage portal protein [Ferruginibacter sp.]
MNWLTKFFSLNTVDEIATYVNHQLNGSAKYNDYSNDLHKLNVIFSNHALLKVFCLQCDLFSLGKIHVYKEGERIQNDPFLLMLKNPNPFQKQSQFLWDVMFWNMVGNTYNYCESKTVSEDNSLYILQNNKIKFSQNMLNFKDKIVLSKTTKNTIENLEIEYNYEDGSQTKLKWGNIIHIPDLTNGSGNWFKGGSRIDALYKIITNSEDAMDSLNINLRFSGKFLVAGKADPENTYSTPMGEEEKQDIETKVNGKKNVHAVKSMVDIKRFVDNVGAQKLDELQLSQYYLICLAFGIPKDVAEAFNSSTFENQEKARGAFVSYCLQPKGNSFFESHATFFGYDKIGKSIVIDWEHLPFMQVFAKERAETQEIKSKTLLNLVKCGVKIEEINKLLGLNLTQIDYESIKRKNEIGSVQTDTAD